MRLNTKEWKEFKLIDIFNVSYGNKLDKNKMTFDNPCINFVSRTGADNGVDVVVDVMPEIQPFPIGSITVALGGSLGSTFIQTKPFYTGQNVAVLQERDCLSIESKLFICKSINYESSIKYFPFGRELNRYIKTVFSIKLPIIYTADQNSNKEPRIDSTHKYSEEGYIPDFEYMENYIKSLHYKPLTTRVKKDEKKLELKVDEWKEFRIGDLFEVVGSKTTKVELLEECGVGKYPYVTTRASNNGIDGYFDCWTEESGVLTIDSAAIGYCAYQNFNFSASDHVEKLVPLFEMNNEVAYFFVTVINAENYKYNYGRKFNQIRIRDTLLKLPILKDQSGQPILDSNYKYSKEGYIPDFEFMEEYINGLPYGDRVG